MIDPIDPEVDLTADQVRQLAARRYQLDLEAWKASVAPVPAHLPSPEEVVRQVLARAAVADRPNDVWQEIRAAAAEAKALPLYERPATVGEMARWVKTRLYGHAPLPPERAVAFLLAFAANELHRRYAELAGDRSRVPDASARSPGHATVAGSSTARGPSSQLQVIAALCETDRAAGELLMLSEYAGQTPDALAALKGLRADAVQQELAAAQAWVRDEMERAGTTPTA